MKAAGKEVREKGLLYFRKPDVNHVEGFKLGRDAQVTFRVYVDEKGAVTIDQFDILIEDAAQAPRTP